jgi:magnesium-transporting ATPase (P-type)
MAVKAEFISYQSMKHWTAQIVNAFMCRSERQSAFSAAMFTNKLLMIGIGLEILFALFVNYTELGNAIFKTAPIGIDVWLSVVPMMVTMVVLEELRKWIVRRRRTGFKD